MLKKAARGRSRLLHLLQDAAGLQRDCIRQRADRGSCASDPVGSRHSGRHRAAWPPRISRCSRLEQRSSCHVVRKAGLEQPRPLPSRQVDDRIGPAVISELGRGGACRRKRLVQRRRRTFPEGQHALVRAVQDDDAEDARRLNARLEPLWVLFREFSSLRVIYASTDPLGICRAAPPRPILPLAGAARQRGGRAQDLWTCTEASPLEAHGCGVARTSERGRYRPKWRGPLGRAACSKADRPLPAKIAHSVSRPSSIADHRLSDYAQRKRVCRPSVPGRTPVASGWLELASTCSPSQACLIARGSKRLLLARGHERFVVCCAAGQVTGRSPSLAFVYGSFRPVHVMGNRT